MRLSHNRVAWSESHPKACLLGGGQAILDPVPRAIRPCGCSRHAANEKRAHATDRTDKSTHALMGAFGRFSWYLGLTKYTPEIGFGEDGVKLALTKQQSISGSETEFLTKNHPAWIDRRPRLNAGVFSMCDILRAVKQPHSAQFTVVAREIRVARKPADTRP